MAVLECTTVSDLRCSHRCRALVRFSVDKEVDASVFQCLHRVLEVVVAFGQCFFNNCAGSVRSSEDVGLLVGKDAYALIERNAEVALCYAVFAKQEVERFAVAE